MVDIYLLWNICEMCNYFSPFLSLATFLPSLSISVFRLKKSKPSLYIQFFMQYHSQTTDLISIVVFINHCLFARMRG